MLFALTFASLLCKSLLTCLLQRSAPQAATQSKSPSQHLLYFSCIELKANKHFFFLPSSPISTLEPKLMCHHHCSIDGLEYCLTFVVAQQKFVERRHEHRNAPIVPYLLPQTVKNSCEDKRQNVFLIYRVFPPLNRCPRGDCNLTGLGLPILNVNNHTLAFRLELGFSVTNTSLPDSDTSQIVKGEH